MSRIGSRIKAVILSVIIAATVLSGIGPAGRAFAETTGNLVIGGNVQEWMLDETNRSIYAATDDGKLLFIDLSDFTLKGNVDLAGVPSDVKMDNGQLYVPIPASKQVQIVDIASRSIVNTVTAPHIPQRVAAKGNKLYYVEKDSFSFIYSYDLACSSACEHQVDVYPHNYYQADLAVDPAADRLYVGESGLSGSALVAYDIDTETIVDQSGYNDDYGFSYPSRTLIVDGQQLFYAGREFNKANLKEIYGTFKDLKLTDVNNRYAVGTDPAGSSVVVFDRNMFQKAGSVPVSASKALIGPQNELYTFISSSKSIQKIVVSLALDMEQPAKEDNRLTLLNELTDLAYDEAHDQVIAVSRDSNKLLYINASAMTVTKEVYIGSMPTDVDLAGDNVYVALHGATHVAVTDAVYNEASSAVHLIPLNEEPKSIAVVNESELFFTRDNDNISGHDPIFHRVNGTVSKVMLTGNPVAPTYYGADLFYDAASDKLFVSEKGLSSSETVALQRNSGTFVVSATSPSFSYPKQGLIMDGVYAYYGKTKLQADTLTAASPAVTFDTEVLAAKGQDVITATSVYRNGVLSFRLPFTADFALLSKGGDAVWLYSKNTKSLYRYTSIDEIKKPRVQATNLSFSDSDQTVGEISGNVTFRGASDQSYVTGYNVYLTDSSGKAISRLGFVPKGGTAGDVSLTVPENTALPDQTAAIQVKAVNEYAESDRFVSIPLWDAPFGPLIGSFTDLDPAAHQVAGTLKWETYKPESRIVAGYKVTLRNGTEIADISAGKPYEIELNAEQMPGTSEMLYVTAYNAGGVRAPSSLVILFGDLQTAEAIRPQGSVFIPAPNRPGFTDMDNAAGRIGGTVHWDRNDEHMVLGYRLYFTDSKGGKKALIGEMKVLGLPLYGFALPSGTVIPQGASDIAIYPYDTNGEGDAAYVNIRDSGDVDTIPPTVTVSEVLDNSTSVKGVTEPYAKVELWKTDQLLGSAQSDERGEFAIPISPQPEGTSLTLTATDQAGNRGLPLTIRVTAHPQETGNSPVTDGSVPSSSTNPAAPPTGTEATAGTIAATTRTDQSGRLVVTAVVDANRFMQLAEASGTSSRLLLDVTAHGDAVNTEIDAGSFQLLLDRNGSALLTVRTSLGSVELPAELVVSALNQLNLAPAGAVVTISISKAGVSQTEELDRTIGAMGGVRLLEPVDFSVTVTAAEGTPIEIANFTTFVGRTLQVPLSNAASFANMTGVVYNPATHSYFPVPTIFADTDGNVTATLYRQGFSVYSVVKNERTFSDLSAGYYAKKEIETLASRWIINGYADGSYRASDAVTRAQFVQMLTRALGILPKQTAPSFHDVKPAAWYAGAITAAAEAGLVKGDSDGSFRPNDPITRQELAVLIAGAMKAADKAPESTDAGEHQMITFQDGQKIGTWASDAVAYTVQAGVLKGFTGNTFAPDQTADRGQTAMALYRMLKALGWMN
ncbi:S-layer homology domain-containing protein [Paenibacillus beijingensis]|uniref:SLH domain-containing protein n=1 Tax=Paenibacillus beijingensis TaxID=1126833 RepID=A0A0D5NI51_9BACL|nr:S-layer homology domain-containing protein [Paenibacillus beijingensis]AJY75069.1 hypothetical protein VN24_11370 [Paenibacillus beijingensis]